MISKRVKLLRTTLDLTQPDFGRKLGVSRDVIANIEYERVEPRPVFLEHICTIFNSNLEWLLTGEGEMFNKNHIDDKSLKQAIELFSELNPKFQHYVLRQIKGLLEVQENNEL